MPWFYKYMIRDKDNGANGGGGDGGDKGGDGGDGGGDSGGDKGGDDDPPKTVSLEEYQVLMNKNKVLTTERNTLKDNLSAKELSQMKDKENWKEVAELKEQEATTAKEETATLKKALIRKEKMGAIRTAALSVGLRKEALDDLDNFDFSDVQIETTSLGNVKILGAKEAVDALKLKKPYLFGKKSSSLNGGLPEVVDGGTIPLDSLMKAEEKARLSGKAEDQAAYKELTLKYNQQKQQTAAR